jgi:hypothetical protein
MAHQPDCPSVMGLACTCHSMLAEPPGVEQRWQPVLPADDVLDWPLGGRLVREHGHERLALRQTDLGTSAAPIGGIRSYVGPNHIAVIATIDHTQRFGDLLHTSISHAKRDPYWAEIKAMRAVFYPAWIDVMMMLPAEEDFVNLHEHAFHLQQCPERWGIR